MFWSLFCAFYMFLGCEDCAKSYAANCPSHGPLIKVRDREIPSKAKLTVPHMLSLKGLGLSSEGLNCTC